MTDTKIQFKGGAQALLSALQGNKVTVTGNDGTVTVQFGDALKKLAHKPHEYMGAVKAALKLKELATPAECSDDLDRLKGHVEACLDAGGNPDGEHGGMDLGAYTRPLKELVDAQPGDTWEEVFDAIDALIQAAIEEHEVRDHSGAAPSMNDRPASAGAPTTQTPAGGSPTASTAHGETAMDEKQLQTLKDSLSAQFNDKLAEVSLQLTAVQGKVTEQETTIKAKDARIDSLEADLKRRDTEKATARVEEAFQTYKDKMSLTDAHKEQMALFLSSKPESFEKLYPHVAGSERHLLANLSGGRPGGTNAGGTVPRAVKAPSLRVLSINLARAQKIELADAQCIVFAAARRARQEAAAA